MIIDICIFSLDWNICLHLIRHCGGFTVNMEIRPAVVRYHIHLDIFVYLEYVNTCDKLLRFICSSCGQIRDGNSKASHSFTSSNSFRGQFSLGQEAVEFTRPHYERHGSCLSPQRSLKVAFTFQQERRQHYPSCFFFFCSLKKTALSNAHTQKMLSKVFLALLWHSFFKYTTLFMCSTNKELP